MGWLLYPYRKIKRYLIKRAYLESLRDEIAEEFLQLLLQLMSLYFLLDKKMRKNIEDFSGLILFKSKDNEIRVLAEFNKNKLKHKELKPHEKILRSILNNEVILEGNFNYIYRFGFIANHIQLSILEMLKLR